MSILLPYINNRRQAIGEVRALADAIIEQHTRWDKGLDQNRMKRDDEPRFTGMTPRMRCERNSREAFAIAAHYSKEA